MDNTLPKAVDTVGVAVQVEADMGVVDMAADVDVDSAVNKGAISIKLWMMMTTTNAMSLLT